MSRVSVLAPAAPPATYSAYTLGRGAGPEALRLEQRQPLPLGPDEVRVRIRAVALNHRDLMFADGRIGGAGPVIVPASDAAGEVLEVGSAVREFQPGDPVVSSFFPNWLSGPATPEVIAGALGGSLDGVLAEQRVLPATAWVHAPANLTHVEAATLPCAGLTAWHALFGLDPLPPGAAVALLGTGGVSVWALQLAKAAGLRVLVTSSDDAKLARVRELGADVTINYRRHPAWGSWLRDLAGGQGVARVLDVGGPDTLAQSIDALQSGGSVAVIGRLAGAEPARIDPAALFLGSKRLIGLMVGSRAMARDLVRFVEQADIHPVIDRVFPYADAAAAYRYLAGSQHLGKVVIRLD
ncbi:zinc-dependent alcohol dehydrogenase family protein [Arenimonas aestuarii]